MVVALAVGFSAREVIGLARVPMEGLEGAQQEVPATPSVSICLIIRGCGMSNARAGVCLPDQNP